MKISLILCLLTCSANADAIIWPPVFQGSISLPSKSHGSGYSQFASEFWIPEWANSTVYRYDKNYNFLGTFSSGQPQMMQIWGDVDGSYYTANWGYNTVTKKTSMSDSTTVWTYNMGTTASAVASDGNYVYAMSSNTNIVSKLNKNTGDVLATITLNNMDVFPTYGGIMVMDNYLIRGTASGLMEYFDLTTGNKVGYYSSGYNIYGSAFDGTNFYIHQNNNTHEYFTISIPIPEISHSLIGLLLLAGTTARRRRIQAKSDSVPMP